MQLNIHFKKIYALYIWPRKKLSVSCNGLKKNRVGRSFFLGGGGGGGGFDDFFVQKCVFYACFLMIWSWEG